MLLGIGAHSKEALTARLAFVLDLRYSMVTQMDLTTIMKQVQLDAAGEQNYEIKDFRKFIEQNLDKNDSRDVTVDGWGTPYQHEIKNARVRIASAGPDKTFGTADDLEVSGNLALY